MLLVKLLELVIREVIVIFTAILNIWHAYILLQVKLLELVIIKEITCITFFELLIRSMNSNFNI